MQQGTGSTVLAELLVIAAFENVGDPAQYRALPSDWLLAVADVVSSGEAIAAGKYKSVNMAGASVITAVLNAVGRADYPFAFGGDGAVVAVPGEAIGPVTTALASVSRWISEDLGLEMRVALVPVKDIIAAGRSVQVARYQASKDLTFAMFAGGGSAWAEAQMKAGLYAVSPAPPGARADLTGLSCRWNPVEARHGHILSIIALPADVSQARAFQELVADIVAIANSFEGTGNPMPVEGPKPKLYFGGVGTEVRARAAKGQRAMARLTILFAIFLTVILDKTGLSLGAFNFRNYRREVTTNSDFRKFDDGLKMTLDVDDKGLKQIEARLALAAEQRVCTFGTHRQDSALVTCLVPSLMTSDHLHFIDGAAGGYAQAAVQMKQKVKAERQTT